MTHRWTISCGLALALLAGLAAADRATALLDDVEAALESAAAELAEDTSKDGKKRFKTATKSLKKLGKDTTSELGDIKLLKKIAGATLKRFDDDTSVVQPIVDAADAFDESIDDTLDAARALVPAVPAKKVKPAQVTKAIERAQKLLDKSRAKDIKPRIAVLFKARKAADKALALAEKLEPTSAVPQVEGYSIVLIERPGSPLRLEQFDEATGDAQAVVTGDGEIFLEDPVPARAPSGESAAFRQGTKIVIVELAEAGAVPVAGTPESEWEFLSWSPDSNTLLAAGTEPDTLAVFDRAGRLLRSFEERVTRGFPIEETFLWSPDGTLVAYRSDRDSDAVKELRVLDPATGESTEVTSADLGTDQIRYFAWAGQSSKLVYPANFDRSSSETELMVVDADGSGRKVLSLPGQDVRDSGSTVNVLGTNPAGDGVLYEFRQDGMGFIGTVNLDGSDPRVIATASANFINEHAWSPRGDRIAYIDDGALRTCNPDGSESVLISDSCPDAVWAPDGSALVYRDGNGSFATELLLSHGDGDDSLQVSPQLVPGGNVEDGYVVTTRADGLRVYLFADAEVNNRVDLNAALVQVGGPAAHDVAESSIVAEGDTDLGPLLSAGLDVGIARAAAFGVIDREFSQEDSHPITLFFETIELVVRSSMEFDVPEWYYLGSRVRQIGR